MNSLESKSENFQKGKGYGLQPSLSCWRKLGTQRYKKLFSAVIGIDPDVPTSPQPPALIKVSTMVKSCLPWSK